MPTPEQKMNPEENQEGKSLNELAGEGHVATPETEKNVWTEYRTDGLIEVRPYVPGQDDDILVRIDHTPELGDFVARFTNDHKDQWILLKSTYDRNHKKTLTDPDDVIERCPQTEEEIMKPVDFKDGIFGMRGDIELVKSKVKNWQGHPQIIPSTDDVLNIGTERLCELSEAQQNLILAYRHLEDARMRLGKAVQAYDGGKSCYPK